jgi:hypothetical protein
MASGLDSVLGIVIPIIAFGVLGFAIYKGFKEPIDSLIFWIREKFDNMRNRDTPTATSHSYGRRNPYGIEGGDISYR